jgi:hypothetical protein
MNKNTPIPDPRQSQNRDENKASSQPNEHTEQNSMHSNEVSTEAGQRDEEKSYTDYNGNSEENNPARAGG